MWQKNVSLKCQKTDLVGALNIQFCVWFLWVFFYSSHLWMNVLSFLIHTKNKTEHISLTEYSYSRKKKNNQRCRENLPKVKACHWAFLLNDRSGREAYWWHMLIYTFIFRMDLIHVLHGKIYLRKDSFSVMFYMKQPFKHTTLLWKIINEKYLKTWENKRKS